MNKYIYHGGKSTEEGLATVSVAKMPGTDRYDVQLDFSSPAAAMDALEAPIRGYEQRLGVPAHHVLAVLASVMTVPCGQIERDGIGNEL